MIHRALPVEVEAITAIELACFGVEAWSDATVRSAIDSERHTVLLDGTDAYGVIALAGDVADLERIAVLPSRRRHGVARELLDALCSTAAEQGAERVLLEVADDNEAALALYRAYGFETISRRRRYYRTGADALVMQVTCRPGCGGRPA